MKTTLLFRFGLLGIASATVLGVLTLFALRMLTENSNIELRRHLLLSLASAFENGPVEQAIQRYESTHRGRSFRSKLWAVSEEGEILASNSDSGLPVSWAVLPKPEEPHEEELFYRLLGLTPFLTVIRLATDEPIYLVVAAPGDRNAYKKDYPKVFLFGSALAFSALISLLLSFLYLRRKSKEARQVLLRLERGDLKARFPIKTFDEMGSLMLDFNRMASEIERLVGRLQETEQARRTLSQELSHDLRTPLTSLKTSVETLSFHWKQMSDEHREEVLEVCMMEIAYFGELLENLLFIAQMDEPRYHPQSEGVNLQEIIEAELKVRNHVGSKLKWAFSLEPGTSPITIGDVHLIRRLIRNALENASRFGKEKVMVQLSGNETELITRIEDDGAGITPEEVALFGKPRNRRLVTSAEASHVSLGLGSVIMLKIVELHQGRLSLRNTSTGSGTVLEIRLPRPTTLGI